MDDQPLASSRVAWLQSRARRRMQESIGIYRLPKPGRTPLQELPQAAIFCSSAIPLGHQNQKIAGFASSYA